MGGKKIDRKKQSLLSRAAKRKATIKKLTSKPVVKHVDAEAIKESFKKSARAHTTVKESKPEAAGVPAEPRKSERHKSGKSEETQE